MEVDEDQKVFGYPHSSKYIFCVQQEKLIEVWNNLRVSHIDKKFEWNIPLI